MTNTHTESNAAEMRNKRRQKRQRMGGGVGQGGQLDQSRDDDVEAERTERNRIL